MSQVMSQGQIATELAVINDHFPFSKAYNLPLSFLKVSSKAKRLTMKSPTAPPPSPLVFLLLAALQSVVTVASTECDPTTPSLASLVSFTDDLRGAAAAYASSSADGTIACPADPNNVFGRSHQRVLLLGIDGLRADAAAMLPLPNLHRLSTMGTSTVSTCTCNTYKSNHNMSMSWVMGHSLAT